MTSPLLKALLLTFTLCWTLPVGAAVPIPPLTDHIMDPASILPAQEKRTLEHTLQSFETQKGRQFVVLVIPTSHPESIEQYALRAADQWQLGYNTLENGVLMVVTQNDHALHINVGYGLEGVLNPAIRQRIGHEIMTPFFNQGDIKGGIIAGVEQMMQVMDGKPLAPSKNTSGKTKSGMQPFFPVLIVLLMAISIGLRSVLGRFPGAIAMGGVTALLAWMLAGTLPVAFISGMLAILFTLLGTMSAPLLLGGTERERNEYTGSGFGGGGASGRW